MRRCAAAGSPTPPTTGIAAAIAASFWGFRPHGLFALDGTPRAIALTSPKTDERDVCLDLVDRCPRTGPLIVIGDKGYASREFHARMLDRHALIVRPRRNDEPGPGPHLAPVRQRIESILWTFKDLLTLERHGARTLHGLRARISQRLLALAAGIALNHQLGRPSRALATYNA